MAIIDQINEDIKESMRNKNAVRLDTLRMLKSKILNVNARGEVEDTEVQKLFKTYLGNLTEAYEQAIEVKRQELADKLKIEIAVVEEFLPKALSHDETLAIVKQALAETEAKTKKELGVVMKAIMKINPGVDGKLVMQILNEHLQS